MTLSEIIRNEKLNNIEIEIREYLPEETLRQMREQALYDIDEIMKIKPDYFAGLCRYSNGRYTALDDDIYSGDWEVEKYQIVIENGHKYLRVWI